MNEIVAKGMAEVSKELAKYCVEKGNLKYAKSFTQKAIVFDKLSKINKGEVIMVRPRKGVTKREENAIYSRIKATVGKYGFDAFRLVANRYITDNREKMRVEREIKEKEAELQELKKRKSTK